MGGINLWWKGIKIYWRESTVSLGGEGGGGLRGESKFLADRWGDWENPGGGFESIEFPSVLKK